MGNSNEPSKAQLGIVGLDDILLGGLRRNRLFLIEGTPGAGKTTLALQFCSKGHGSERTGSISRFRKLRQS
jgi:circadian clock protein KaiC